MGAMDLLGFSIERTRNVVEFVVCASKVEEWSNPRGMNDLSRDGGDTTRFIAIIQIVYIPSCWIIFNHM